jgi:hypothetical protein
MDEPTIYCTYHPNRPTALRCNRCGNPICSSCAVRTPVGYRCKNCVREQQKVFETAYWYDFIAAFAAAAVVCGAGSILSTMVGYFSLFIAIVAGYLAARVAQWAVHYRRHRFLWLSAVAGGIVGCLPILFIAGILAAFSLLMSRGGWLDMGVGLIWPLMYAVVSVVSLIINIKGIRF